MIDLIPRIREVWSKRRNEVLESAEKIVEALLSTETATAGAMMDLSVLEVAYGELSQRFDENYGGFSQAPKFPSPHNLLFLLRYWKRSGDEKALRMVEKTLLEMRKGGVYDQIGYGFHRYSTDREWLVPHFEKMLYDQAMLSIAYLEAYQATGNERYAQIGREIFTYILRDMKSPEGGFFSAEDADSEGVEGKFYVWREDEAREALDKEDADLAVSFFGMKKEGNFLDEATRSKTGSNILHLKKTISDLAADFPIPPPEIEMRIERIRKRLFEVREKRIHPYKDDKVLTDWNGLMIAGFARGAQVLEDSACLEAAKGAAEFILNRMRTPNGRLLHRYRDGQAGIAAHLDDYAFFIWGLIELYEASFEANYLKTALELNGDMLEHYWDQERGGLFFIPDDGESLLLRKKEIYDGAVPSGNSIAMLNLLKLARLTGKGELETKAGEIAQCFSSHVRQMPSGFTQFLSAFDFAVGPSHEVVVAGPPAAADTGKMLKELRSSFLPGLVVLFRPSDEASPTIDEVADFVKTHVSVGGKATAYVCSGHACKRPTTEIQEMMDQINRATEGG
jgi:uncharacterized protein